MTYLLVEKSDKLIKNIYLTTLQFPQVYQFSIGEQLRRSSLSVVLNIVEAGARKSIKEKRYLLNISFGSLKETKYLLLFAKEFELVKDDEYSDFLIKLDELAKILYGILYKKI